MAEKLNSGSGSPARSGNWAFGAVAAVVVVAVIFGGGGSKAALQNLLVQLAALFALAFHKEAFAEFWMKASLSVRLLVAATVLLPLLTIIPLPPAIWNALPGRELVAQSLNLVEEGSAATAWTTFSVDPIRTLLALTALISPLAVLAIGWATPRDRLVIIGWIVVALGIANLFLGIPQVMSDGASGVIYSDSNMAGVLFGTFANRNSTGLFCVGALALALMLPPPPGAQRFALGLRLFTCILLILAVVLTRSRTALVLAAVPLALAGLRMIMARRSGSGPKGWLVLAPVVLGVAAVGALVAIAPGRFSDTIERFEETDNPRAYIWEDAVYSADRYWPVGSGIGTFDEVFQIDESLENMTVRRAGRAHSDYIEVAIEAGIPGLALVAGWLALLVWLSWRARHSRHRWIAWSGSMILLTIALQSITDYPLRNQTMLILAAFALVLLTRFGPDPEEQAA